MKKVRHWIIPRELHLLNRKRSLSGQFHLHACLFIQPDADRTAMEFSGRILLKEVQLNNCNCRCAVYTFLCPCSQHGAFYAGSFSFNIAEMRICFIVLALASLNFLVLKRTYFCSCSTTSYRWEHFLQLWPIVHWCPSQRQGPENSIHSYIPRSKSDLLPSKHSSEDFSWCGFLRTYI